MKSGEGRVIRDGAEKKRADAINKALISLRKLEEKSRRSYKVGREDIDSGA